MSRLLAAALLLAGCRNTARDADCTAVRRALALYKVGSGSAGIFDAHSSGIFDVNALRGLEHHKFGDPEVASATKDALATQWQVYTPYGSDHGRAVDHLRALCR